MIMKRNVFLMITVCAFGALSADAATVVPRNSRASLSRMPTVSTQSLKTNTTTTQAEVVTGEPKIEDAPIVENKSTQFDEALGEAMTSSNDVGANELAEQIRAQRAALDAADARAATVDATNAARASGRNACDTGLRECMTAKCGNNFAKCASDTDTAFGTKLESCRRDLKCSGTEFKLFSAEIKSDRDAAIQLKSFNDIIDCGQTYDTCIVNECGNKYSKCLGKSAGDTAISKCNSIAQRCIAMDSGLANRTMNVFATLRQTAEKQIVTDEKQLYALRDQMKSICARLGAMFDERSLDCVYTVNFYAGNDSTLYASKKAYAGGSFDCTPNWFGVDVTTFKENAYRLTREQTSASSAMLGSGVGMAVGAVTSGAISNAIDAQRARRAADEAKATKEEPESKTTEPEKIPAAAQKPAEPDLSTPETAKQTVAKAGAQKRLDEINNEDGKKLVSQAKDKAGQLMTEEQVLAKRTLAKADAKLKESNSIGGNEKSNLLNQTLNKSDFSPKSSSLGEQIKAKSNTMNKVDLNLNKTNSSSASSSGSSSSGGGSGDGK